ncbi:MAG: carboxymuconolactone decarboxylase family protein [Actinobacteria bacterium]|nr:carboxymuconolactone decarboxylase family protein [Actinomycetota bacterium]
MLDAGEARSRAAEVGVPEGMAGLNVFRVLLHDPATAAALNGLLHRLLWKGDLDQRLRELVIMRIGWVSGAVYEWTQHWHVAVALGIDEADLFAVRDWEAYGGFGPVERAVLAATDETLADGSIGGATWSACAEQLDEALLVELVAAIGNWGMFARMLKSLDVPLDDGMEPWPPDGCGPEKGAQR